MQYLQQWQSIRVLAGLSILCALSASVSSSSELTKLTVLSSNPQPTATLANATKSKLDAESSPTEKSVPLAERTRIEPGNIKNLFRARSWLPPPPPPPPPPAPVAAQPPVAPPIPFTYLGSIGGDASTRQVLLSRGESLFIIKKNEVIENTYRIDNITNKGIEITFLPLNEQQVISINTE